MRMRAIAIFLALCACSGAEGTITVDVVAAPGSDLLAQIVRARMTLSNPLQVVDAEREADGTLSLSLDLVAPGTPYSSAARRVMMSNSFAFGGNNASLVLASGDLAT